MRTYLALLIILGCSESHDPGVERAGPQIAQAAVEPAPCPARMRVISGVGGCMDAFEARIDMQSGQPVAVPASAEMPTTTISYTDAELACAHAGFRLCTREEWNAACGGEEQRAYPYGSEYEDGRCNSIASSEFASTARLEVSGSRTDCVNPDGIYDLSGNLGEWINSPDETGDLRELRGGSFANYPRYTVCEQENRGFQPMDAAFSGQGFRCCADES